MRIVSQKRDLSVEFERCEIWTQNNVIYRRIGHDSIPIKDKWLTVTETLDGKSDVSFQFGKYKVFSDKPTADRRYRDIVAYDAMLNEFMRLESIMVQV